MACSPPTPSHCVPDLLDGVPGRLELDRRPTRLPTLARERAVFPPSPSSFRRASAVASSSIPDHPSCVPRNNEWATLGEEWCSCDAGRKGGLVELFALPAWRRNCLIEEVDGDGGRCEKSVVCTRREWWASLIPDDELVDVCLVCFSGFVVDILTLVPSPTLSRRRSFPFSREVEGIPTPRLRCLRAEAFSSFALSLGVDDEAWRLVTSAPVLSSSNSSDVRFFALRSGVANDVGGDVVGTGDAGTG